MKKNKLFKILSILLCVSFLLQQTGFAQVASVELNLSSRFASAGSALSNVLSPDKFRPVHLRSISYDQLNNNFKLLIDKGDTKNLNNTEIESTTKDLLNYFFVGIALPNSSFWVNLRPDAPTNIIDPLLAQTEVGKILLEADLQLKKDTAEATNPQSPEGKAYWNKLYAKANELYGNQNVNIPTLTRPWIVPDEIIIREATNNAYIYKATLKVMLEQDYLKDNSTYSFKDDKAKQLNEYSSQIIRQEIIPKLTKEINSAKRYAQLRQVYYSLILAQWFKARNLNNPNNPYAKQIDRKDLTNLKTNTPYSVDTYFNSYKQNFTQGQYNIKEPVYTPYGQVLRSYFSGGLEFNMTPPIFGSFVSPGGLKYTVVPNKELIGNRNDIGAIVTLQRDGTNATAEIVISSQEELEKKIAAIDAAHEFGKGHALGIQKPDGTFNKNKDGLAYNQEEIGSKYTTLLGYEKIEQRKEKEIFTSAEAKNLIKRGIAGDKATSTVIKNSFSQAVQPKDSQSLLLYVELEKIKMDLNSNDETISLNAAMVIGSVAQMNPKLMTKEIVNLLLEVINNYVKGHKAPGSNHEFIWNLPSDRAVKTISIIAKVRPDLMSEDIIVCLLNRIKRDKIDDHDVDLWMSIAQVFAVVAKVKPNLITEEVIDWLFGNLKSFFRAKLVPTIVQAISEIAATRKDLIVNKISILKELNLWTDALAIGAIAKTNPDLITEEIISSLSDRLINGNQNMRDYSAQALGEIVLAKGVFIAQNILNILLSRLDLENERQVQKSIIMAVAKIFKANQDLISKNTIDIINNFSKRIFGEIDESIAEIYLTVIKFQPALVNQDIVFWLSNKKVRTGGSVVELAAEAFAEIAKVKPDLISRDIVDTLFWLLRENYDKKVRVAAGKALIEISQNTALVLINSEELFELKQLIKDEDGSTSAKEKPALIVERVLDSFKDVRSNSADNKIAEELGEVIAGIDLERVNFYERELLKLKGKSGFDNEDLIAGYSVIAFLLKEKENLSLWLDFFDSTGEDFSKLTSLLANIIAVDKGKEAIAILKETSDIKAANISLEKLLLKINGLDFNDSIRDWEALQKWLDYCNQTLGLLDQNAIRKIIMTMRFWQAGVGIDKLFYKTATGVPAIRNSLISLISKSLPILTKRRLVKALAFGNVDQINSVRNQSTALVKATGNKLPRFENGGISGDLKDVIHSYPSPSNVDLVKAYLIFLKNGDSSYLINLGYQIPQMASESVFDQERSRTEESRVEIIARCELLLASLEEIYGKANIRNDFETWQKEIIEENKLKQEISSLIQPQDIKGIDDLQRIVIAREKLNALILGLSGKKLLLSIVLDNSLDLLFYNQFNKIKNDFNFNHPQEAAKIIRILLANTRLNGYGNKGELIKLETDLTKQDQESFNSTYQAIEGVINESLQAGIDEYQKMAQKLYPDQAQDFIANLFRGDTIFLLSEALQKVQGSHFLRSSKKVVSQVIIDQLEKLSDKEGLSFTKEIANSNELIKWMKALSEYPLLADKITAHIIITLRILHKGDVQAGIKFWGDFKDMPKVRNALILFLKSNSSLLWKQLLVKFLPLVSDNQLIKIRDLAVELQESMQKKLSSYASDYDDISQIQTSEPTGEYIAARIRNAIHRNPSNKINLILLQAYKVYLNEGFDAYKGYLANNLEAQVLPMDKILDDRSNFDDTSKALKKCDELIALLGDLTGKGSGKIIMQSRFEAWEKTVFGQNDLAAKISNLINFNSDNSTDFLVYLGKIVEARKDLQKLFTELNDDEGLMASYSLDNALETLYYVNCDKIIDDKNVDTLVLVSSLLENTSLNGYSFEKSNAILKRLKAWREKKSLKISAKEALNWNELYAIYLDIEKDVINVNSDLIINNFFEEAAKEEALRLSLGITNPEDIPAEILRNDTISLLSKVLSAALEKAGIGQILIPGEGSGKVRIFNKEADLESKPPQAGDIVILGFDITLQNIQKIPFTVSAVISSLNGFSPLSHLAIQIRERGIPFASCFGVKQFKGLEGQLAKFNFVINGNRVILEKTEKLDNEYLKENEVKKIELPRINSEANQIIYTEQFGSGDAGNKASGLEKIPSEFLPSGFALSSNFYDTVLNDPVNAEAVAELAKYLQKAMRNPAAKDLVETLKTIRLLISQLIIPDAKLAEILAAIEKTMGKDKDLSLIVRSSMNAEDLPGYAGAGVYGSYKNVQVEKGSLAENIKKVWASVWENSAFNDRQAHGIDHAMVQPGVLIQELYPSDYHATIYTQDPLNEGKLVIQLKQGLGEPDEYDADSAKNFSGSPYLFIYDPDSKELSVKGWADISHKLVLKDGYIQTVLADYNNDPIRGQSELLKNLAQVALKIATRAGAPQDIEGGIRNVNGSWEFRLFQSRDQVNTSKISSERNPGNPSNITAEKKLKLVEEFEKLLTKIINRKQHSIRSSIGLMEAVINKDFITLGKKFNSEHLNLLLDRYDNLSSEAKEVLEVATIFHDLGSSVETRDWQHNQAGSTQVKNILKKYYREEQFIDQVAKIIYYHGLYTHVGVDFLPKDFSELSAEEKDIVLLIGIFDLGARGDGSNVLVPAKLDELLQLRKDMDKSQQDFYIYRMGNLLSPFYFTDSVQRNKNAQEILKFVSLRKETADDAQFKNNWNDLIRVYAFALFKGVGERSYDNFAKLLLSINNMVETQRKLHQIDDVIIDTDIDLMALISTDSNKANAYIKQINDLLEKNQELSFEQPEYENGKLVLKIKLLENSDALKKVAGAASTQVVNSLGGIDFRFLPIVTQSMGSLKASMRGIPVNTLQQINLTREWSDINRLVSSGIAPSTERLKEYFAASCFKGNLDTDNQKIIACISDILRMEELTCSTTDATLKDILVVLGSGRSGEDLKLSLSGVN